VKLNQVEMSSENKEMEVVSTEDLEVEIDELKVAFELLEEKTSDSPKDYQDLLLNPRMDDAAVKIKEQCIYK
jgi:hypothetical protein